MVSFELTRTHARTRAMLCLQVHRPPDRPSNRRRRIGSFGTHHKSRKANFAGKIFTQKVEIDPHKFCGVSDTAAAAAAVADVAAAAAGAARKR